MVRAVKFEFRAYNVIESLWDSILPCNASNLSRIMSSLGYNERGPIRERYLKEERVMEVLSDYPAILRVNDELRANIGENVFHVTSLGSIPGIVLEGLTPKVCDDALKDAERTGEKNMRPSIPTVFLSHSPTFAATACEKARLRLDQVLLEIKREDLDLRMVNSYGWDQGPVSDIWREGSRQLGSHQPIKKSSIIGVYFRADAVCSGDINELYELEFPIKIDVGMSSGVECGHKKNNWSRGIAEYKSGIRS